jgi:hypothetical protein
MQTIFASYVDDIICCTTDKGLLERFFDHLRKIWAIECTGKLDRFLGIHFQRMTVGHDRRQWGRTLIKSVSVSGSLGRRQSIRR